MKKLCLLVITTVALTGMVSAQKKMSTLQKPTVVSEETKAVCKWKVTDHNFGKIPQGKPVSFTYEVTNTGNAPLIIVNVQPGCGCTTQDYTKEAIAPGKTGFVTLTYNAAGIGQFTKSATVTTNTDSGPITLAFSGEVVGQ